MTIRLLSISVGFKETGLGNAQPGGVADGQNRSMLQAAYAAEELEDFLWAQDDRQLLRPFGAGMTSSKVHSLLSETLYRNLRAATAMRTRARRQLLARW